MTPKIYLCDFLIKDKSKPYFSENFVSELEGHGMAYANRTSKWASAPLIVPKAGQARFSFTVHLRSVNAYTLQHHYPVPEMEQELTKLNKAKLFAIIDL